MESLRSLMDKISVLEKKASALRESEKKRAIAEMRKLIELHDVQPAELFSETRPSVIVKSVGRPVSTGGKRILPPKYRDPATGKTWNGHGKTPLWLPSGNRDAYLIAGQADVASDTAKPRKKGKLKGKSALPPKYRDPATGKTWNGHGKKPFWLPIDNKEAYLIAGPAGVAGNTEQKGQAKAKLSAALKSSAAKLAKAAPKPKKSAKPAVKRKTDSSKTDVSSPAVNLKPVTLQAN